MIELEALEKGILNDELFLEYQPIVELDKGCCIGAEALVRWRRASGIVPPSEFIPLIEDTPLSGALTYWVIERFAEELGDWLHGNPRASMSINVPPEILGRGGLEYAVRKAGLGDVIDQLVMEITERSIPDRLGLKALDMAAMRGVTIALDDMDMEATNAIVLSRCKVHIVKIDGALIRQIGNDGVVPDWLVNLSALSRSSNLGIIAEGVETEAQASALRDVGIAMAQGYLFGRPMSAEAFRLYFEEHR
ncbi:MAG: EAL domain-containing protein [Thiohalocapsa sp.]